MNALLKNAIPCEIKIYKGKKYITLNNKNIIAADCGRNCPHPCKRPLLYKIENNALWGECPKLIFGFTFPVEYLQKERTQALLDKWIE